MKSKTPKVLHELAGIPILGHVMASALAMNPDRVVVVLRHEKERIAEYLASHFPKAEIAHQDEIPGTGRATEVALDVLGDFTGDVLILSGDVPLIDVESLNQLVDRHRANGTAGVMVSVELENPQGYGRIVRRQGSAFEGEVRDGVAFTSVAPGPIQMIVEQRDADEIQNKIREVNAGIYVFSAPELSKALGKVGTENSQGEKYLTDVVGILLAEGKAVQAQQIQDHWLVAGINDRAQLSEVAAELNRRIVRAWQLAGVMVVEPGSTWIDITVSLGEDAQILPGTQLHGLTEIGPDAIVGPDTTLRDTKVGAGARVNRTDATGAVVSEGANVGPFAYLRPGTELGPGGKVGAFVETKNAKIGTGAKVPHLSYVGDAEIGEGANIGAGTIFANYDGVAKHRSSVGPHARTGSGNVFVAPVNIGAGAYTAAGSTIRRDVEPGALALNPAAQKNLADWVLQNRPGSNSAAAASEEKK
jgi:bifunctional UDP-N-acetylglucosamine pyrophosphorylase/glucosamine-1-phosphate N-acetyltransferase